MFDKKHKTFSENFTPGMKVYLLTDGIKSKKTQFAKFKMKYVGPFEIFRKTGPDSYILKGDKGLLMNPLNQARLRRYDEQLEPEVGMQLDDTYIINEDDLPTDFVNKTLLTSNIPRENHTKNDTEYEQSNEQPIESPDTSESRTKDTYTAEKIVAKRRNREGTFLKVRWSGLDANHDSWLHISEFDKYPDILDEFNAKQRLKEERKEARIREEQKKMSERKKGTRKSARLNPSINALKSVNFSLIMFCIIKCFKILTVSALDHIVIEHDSKNRAIYPAKHNLDQWKEHTYNFDHDDIQNIQNYRSNKNGRAAMK